MDSYTNASVGIDVYQIVTNQIITLLEAGIVPWQQPWVDSGPPRNLFSKRHYRGINFWLLLSLNYVHNEFLTWDQIKAVGGSVNKGEKGHMVVYWKNVQNPQDEVDEEGNPIMIQILQFYKVWNIEQCRDLPERFQIDVSPCRVAFNPIEKCEAVITSMPLCPIIRHKEQRAFYNYETDVINMPKKKSFKTPESYYVTLFHELVHSTGSEKRLGRNTLSKMVPYGSPGYSLEELIAEMGSAYLCQSSGILSTEISDVAAYLANWLEVFKNDKRFIIQACGEAQKAVNFILNTTGNEAKQFVGAAKVESVNK